MNNQSNSVWTELNQTMKHSTPSNPKTFQIHQPIKANPLKQTQLLEHPPNKSTSHSPNSKPIRGITQANHQTKPTKSQQTHPLPHHRNPSNHKKTHTHWLLWPIRTQKPNTHQPPWPIRAQQPNGQRRWVWVQSHHHNVNCSSLWAAVKGRALSSLPWRFKFQRERGIGCFRIGEGSVGFLYKFDDLVLDSSDTRSDLCNYYFLVLCSLSQWINMI